MGKLRWIDSHTHVCAYNRDGTKREDILPPLLDVLDSSGWDLRFIIDGLDSMDFISRMTQEGARAIHEVNGFVHDLVQRAPDRLYGSCIVNPHFLDESLEAMHDCFGRWGFVKLGEMVQYAMKYQMNNDGLEGILRLAAHYDVPVQVHISTSNVGQGPGCGVEQLIDLFGAVERVPEAKYILAHFVGTHKDDPPVVDEYLDAIEKRFGRWPDNFWAEIADFNSPGVKSVLKRVPLTRLIAGTDWTTHIGPPFLPYGIQHDVGTGSTPIWLNPYPPSVDALVDFLRESGARYADIPLIGYRNAAELYKIHM